MFRFITSIALLALTPSLYAQTVNIDWDKTKPFPTFSTYAWIDGTKMLNPLMHQRAVNAVNYHLASKGLELVESSPDIYVTYHAATRDEVRVQEWGYNYHPGWYGYPGASMSMGTSSIDIDHIVVGTWVVDILDADKNLIWRAVAETTVTQDPEKVEKKINRAAEKMFKRFPPQNK
jgi:hypothetical protein